MKTAGELVELAEDFEAEANGTSEEIKAETIAATQQREVCTSVASGLRRLAGMRMVSARNAKRRP